MLRTFNRMSCYNQDPNGTSADIMWSGSGFRVSSPLLAMKSLAGPQVYVTLSVGTCGEILDLHDQLGRPGIVMIQVNGETLYSFARDLEQRTLLETTPSLASDLMV